MEATFVFRRTEHFTPSVSSAVYKVDGEVLLLSPYDATVSKSAVAFSVKLKGKTMLLWPEQKNTSPK